MGYRHLVVIAGNFSFSFPIKMLGHIRSNLKPDQNLVHHSTLIKADVERRWFQSVLEQPPPVALIALALRPQPDMIAAYQRAQTPIVLVDEEADGASTVATDNFRGGYLAGEHLAKTGRKRVAIVCGKTNVKGGYNALNRLDGFRAGLAAHGVTLSSQYIIEVLDYSYQDGVEAMTKWLHEKLPLDAVFSAAGDDCATGMLRVAQERGVRVPDDLAMVGYDDIDSAKFATPALTTIRQPLQQMATAAYDIASDADNDASTNPRRIRFEPELIIRASTT